jgi:hypothetical protein
MSQARAASLATFAVLATAAVAVFLSVPATLGWAAGLALGVAAIVVPGRMFDRLATAEERRRDLEERARSEL